MKKKHDVSVPPALTHALSNERGAMLVLAVMLLLLLTVIGLIATGGSITEMMVSGNSRIYTDDIYKADGANREVSGYANSNAWPLTDPLEVKALAGPDDPSNLAAWPTNEIPDPVPLGQPALPNQDRGVQDPYAYRVEYDKWVSGGAGSGASSGVANHLFDIRTVRNSVQIRVGYKRKGPDPSTSEE